MTREICAITKCDSEVMESSEYCSVHDVISVASGDRKEDVEEILRIDEQISRIDSRMQGEYLLYLFLFSFSLGLFLFIDHNDSEVLVFAVAFGLPILWWLFHWDQKGSIRKVREKLVREIQHSKNVRISEKHKSIKRKKPAADLLESIRTRKKAKEMEEAEEESRRESERREKARKRKEEKTKEAKIYAFSRRNFQSNHNYPTNSQKERAWKWRGGACIYCGKDCTKVEISFWWRIYPELGVVTACDLCAANDGLVEEEGDNHQKRSRSISKEVRDRVWNRDKGKCRECGSNEDLEFDHIIPHSKGGANTDRNIQLLCQECNRRKSDNIG